MEFYNFNLKESQELREITKDAAKHKYMNGFTIFLEVHKNDWRSVQIGKDGLFPNFSCAKYYLMHEYDDDKLIVTNHPSIANFWRSRGINAKVVEYTRPNQVQGKTLYGCSIPMHIIERSNGAYLINVNSTSLNFDTLTVDQIEKIGYQVKKYKVMAKPYHI